MTIQDHTSDVEPVLDTSSSSPAVIDHGSIGGLTLSDEACQGILDAAGLHILLKGINSETEHAFATLQRAFNMMMNTSYDGQVSAKDVKRIAERLTRIENEPDEEMRAKLINRLRPMLRRHSHVSDPPHNGSDFNVSLLRAWVDFHLERVKHQKSGGPQKSFAIEGTVRWALGAYVLIYKRKAAETEHGPAARFVVALLHEGRRELDRHEFADRKQRSELRALWGVGNPHTIRTHIRNAIAGRGRAIPTDDAVGDAARQLALMLPTLNLDSYSPHTTEH
ncbi:MAG: hypothetical protein AAF311_13405 [Pseudomonadota bacterium]